MLFYLISDQPTIFAALPIGEYAAVALLVFFGLKSIKDAWELPLSTVVRNGSKNPELGEFVEAEEIVKEEVTFILQKSRKNTVKFGII